jgi:hypothetical protein
VGVFVLRLSKVVFLAIFLLGSVGSGFAQTTDSEPIRLLPKRVGDFKQVSATTPLAGWTDHYAHAVAVATEEASFAGKNGTTVRAGMVRFRQDANAYQLLSLLAANYREQHPEVELREGYGTAGFALPDQILFFKGTHFVRVNSVKSTDPTTLEAFAAALSETLDKGEGDIPVLIKHLPNADEGRKNAIYLNSFSDLNPLRLQQPVLSAIQSGGNADAALATYGPSKVLVVEFNTPQLAADNDRQIIARIQELWKLGQPAPTAYERVGNYSVFVFDAPDEATAKRLIDEVKYEQVVQWLGENPNIYKEAEKYYMNTTLGVLVAVLKASGYALVACLGLGGLIGGLLFTYRRSQQKAVTFSDAGGMLRLNLDNLTGPQTDPARLLRERN